MVNGVDIAVGGVSGAGFGSIFDGITELVRNAVEFTTSHTNIKSTLEVLQPLIQEIEGKNNTLLLQDEELRDLKEEMEEGVKRVQKLSEESVSNYCMRPFYNMELDGMDKSLKRLLRILQVQGVRDVKEALVQVKDCKSNVKEVFNQVNDCKTDVKEVLVQVNDCKSNVKEVLDQVNDCKTDVKEVLVQINDCKTDVNKISIKLDDCKTEIVEGLSAWKGKTTDQLDQVANNGEENLNLTKRVLERVERINGPSGFVSISEKVASLVEMEALRSSLLSMGHSVDEALSIDSIPTPVSDSLKRLQRWRAAALVLNRSREFRLNRKWLMPFDEVNTLRMKVEEGTKLIRQCSNVVVWTDHKMDKYARKLDDLAKFLEASEQRLKRTNSTMPKGFDTQNSRLHFCSPPISVPCINSSIDCC